MAQNILNKKNKIVNLIKRILNTKFILLLVIVYLMICLIVNPAKYIDSASNGISIWANTLLPSLLPFFILTKIVSELNVYESLSKFFGKPIQQIFNTSPKASLIFFISILSGYPIGSKIVADEYKSGRINYTDLHRIITFTSVSGPLFIIGTVGTNMLQNITFGYIIIISHILSAILNGVCYKNYTPKMQYKYNIQSLKYENKNVLICAVKSSIDSILVIGGLVCIFFVGMEAISSLFNVNPIVQGIIEITKGCYEISISNYSDNIKVVICTGLITFGGFCIHSQAMSFLKDCNVSYKFFFLQKLTQTLFSIIIAYTLTTMYSII